MRQYINASYIRSKVVNTCKMEIKENTTYLRMLNYPILRIIFTYIKRRSGKPSSSPCVTNSRGGLTLHIKGKTRGGLSVCYIGYFVVTLWCVWSMIRWILVEGLSRTVWSWESMVYICAASLSVQLQWTQLRPVNTNHGCYGPRFVTLAS